MELVGETDMINLKTKFEGEILCQLQELQKLLLRHRSLLKTLSRKEGSAPTRLLIMFAAAGVESQKVVCDGDGDIKEYRVSLKVTFVLSD
ncbi:MAG: hypothetical protein ACI9H8_001591 [Lysobacterales bacterium]